MDSNLLAAVIDEAGPRLIGLSVTKVEAVGKTSVLLRFGGERSSLWLSAHPELSRLGLVDAPPSLAAPRRAPAPLGDVLKGARLVAIEPEPSGRVARLRFEREAPRHASPVLVAELIPRFANLVLIGDDSVILWSRREFPGSGRAREIRPGVAYVPPQPAKRTTDGAPHSGSEARLEIPPGLGANAFADELFRVREREEERGLLRGQLRRVLVRRREKAAKALRHIERRLEEAQLEPEIRRRAELLAAHLTRARRGLAKVTVPDFDGASQIEIPLDPKLDPRENVEELFRRARRLTRAGEDLEAQRSIQVAQIEEADEAVARVESGLTDENLLALVDRYVPREEREPTSIGEARSGAKGMRGVAGTTKETRGPALPSGSFARRYTLPGGWEVWVGRSAAQNDELTHRVAGPRDLWFHARGAQGSHAILRISSGKGEPAKSVIEAAAAIAAFHSKARNSKLVPVAFTERRFVRKPRGAPPGTASMDREKVLFVEPRVPKEAAEDA